MVDFPRVVVLIVCLVFIDGCWGEVTLEQAEDIRFNSKKNTTIEADKGQVFCFKNRVDCVEYEYSASDDVLAFIVPKDSLANSRNMPEVSTLDFVGKSNRTGRGRHERVDIKVETGSYCVVFVNGQFDSPFYVGRENGTEVYVNFEIEGCPTKYQKFVAILVPIGVVLVVAVGFSAWWIRRRRRILKAEREKHHNGPEHLPHHMPYPHNPAAYQQPPHGHVALPIPSQYHQEAYHNQHNGVAVAHGQMNVPMGPIPYAQPGGACFPSTGVPLQEVAQPQRTPDPTRINSVWEAAAQAGGTDGTGNPNVVNLSSVDSRGMNTVPYASGLIPGRDFNVVDSDTRV